MSSNLFGYGGTGRIALLLAATAVSLGGGIASFAVSGPAWAENIRLKEIEEKTLVRQKRNNLIYLAVLGVLLIFASIFLGVISADNIYYRLKGIPHRFIKINA